MSFLTRLERRYPTENKPQAPSVLETLPQLENEGLRASNPLLRNSAPVCNITNWRPIVKRVLLYLVVPPGFKRNSEPLRVYISLDKSNVYLDKRIKVQRSVINIQDEDGNPAGDIVCNTEVVRMMVEGNAILNTVFSGFEPVQNLEVDNPSGKGNMEVTENTAFNHLSIVLFDDQAGYMCKECAEDEQEVEIRLNVSKPFVILPDGTKVEADIQVTRNRMILEVNETSPTFDDFFDGSTEQMIQVVCEVTAQVEVEVFS